MSASPKVLYKYRNFSNLSLTMLLRNYVFFADPTTFNDPLDTSPTLEPDLNNKELENIFSQLMSQRLTAERDAAAKNFFPRDQSSPNLIREIANKKIEQKLNNLRYSASDPSYETSNPLQFILANSIQKELLLRYNKGIFSVAEDPECPLMWSHYGDQHRGICIGYSIENATSNIVRKVSYDDCRSVTASDVKSMLRNEDGAQDKVDNAVIFKKAKPWEYEREWRMLGSRGENFSPLDVEEIVFGMRCDFSVIYTVVKALEDRDQPVNFFEIREKHHSFSLVKCELNTQEILSSPPKSLYWAKNVFNDLDDD